MATIVLQAAGAALGALFGPVGAVIGRAAGALAGYAIDQSLCGEHRTVDGARLSDLDMQTSQEGSAIPRVYGRARITGEMIWATRLEEVVSEQDAGGKGAPSGTTVRNYTYYANFAIGLCEGPIAAIGRVWADGKPFSLRNVTHRIYLGDDEQLPDSLIEAKQGDGNAPAYRGTAYIVFERMALEDFGNRVPVLSFEVIRPVGALELGPVLGKLPSYLLGRCALVDEGRGNLPVGSLSLVGVARGHRLCERGVQVLDGVLRLQEIGAVPVRPEVGSEVANRLTEVMG